MRKDCGDAAETVRKDYGSSADIVRTQCGTWAVPLRTRRRSALLGHHSKAYCKRREAGRGPGNEASGESGNEGAGAWERG